LGVRYVCSRSGFIIGLGGPCCRFHGLSYLLMAASVVLEDGGEKCRAWVRESSSQRALALCIREARTDCLLAGW
jgi:hypothetical protein